MDPTAWPRRGTIRAVIFDFDGVLVDSMTQHWRAYHRTLAPFGIDLPREEIFKREGGRSATIIKAVLDKYGRPVSEAEAQRLAEEKNVVFRGYGAPPLSDGAVEVVSFVRLLGAKTGLATGTTLENLRFLLGPAISLFDAVYSADDHGPEKPDPAPYAETAKRLGVPPRECLVVENAPFGIRSAILAGCPTIAVATTLDPTELSAALKVYRNLQEVKDALGDLL